jgi:hypothetical protein
MMRNLSMRRHSNPKIVGATSTTQFRYSATKNSLYNRKYAFPEEIVFFDSENQASEYAQKETHGNKTTILIERENRVNEFYPWEHDRSFNAYKIENGHKTE